MNFGVGAGFKPALVKSGTGCVFDGIENGARMKLCSCARPASGLRGVGKVLISDIGSQRAGFKPAPTEFRLLTPEF